MSVDDVFPRRNLLGSAEDWGRTVEGEIRGTQRSLEVLGQSLAGQNRTFASSLEEISRQLNAISEQQNALQAVISALPRPALSEGTNTSWSPDTSWATVASTSLSFPAGTTTGRFHAVGTARSNMTGGNGIPAGSCRVLIGGVSGIEMNFTGMITGSTTIDARISGTSQQSRVITGPGSVTAELQVQIAWLSGSLGSGSWSSGAQVVLSAQFTP